MIEGGKIERRSDNEQNGNQPYSENYAEHGNPHDIIYGFTGML